MVLINAFTFAMVWCLHSQWHLLCYFCSIYFPDIDIHQPQSFLPHWWEERFAFQSVLELEPWAFCILGKCAMPKLQPQDHSWVHWELQLFLSPATRTTSQDYSLETAVTCTLWVPVVTKGRGTLGERMHTSPNRTQPANLHRSTAIAINPTAHKVILSASDNRTDMPFWVSHELSFVPSQICLLALF